MTILDGLGLIGVCSIVAAYLMLQIDRLEAKGLAYSVLNFLGAALILVSLFGAFNLSAAVMEAVWALISLYGIVSVWRRGRASRH